jgi:hypothetical protein
MCCLQRGRVVQREAEKDLGARTGSYGASHVSGQEREADLVRGCTSAESEQGSQRREKGLAVHPPETFSRDHLEVDTLVSVLRVDQMR